jgi:tRNA U55 pseudouridine synthase TruB
LRYGVFDIEDAVSLPRLESAFCCGYWQRYLYPIDVVLSHWAVVIVSDDTGQKIRNGRPVVLGSGGEGADCLQQPSSTCTALASRCRAYTLDGSFLAVLRFNKENGQWQPKKVFCGGL